LLVTGLGVLVLILSTQIPALPNIDYRQFIPQLAGLAIILVCFLLNRVISSNISAIIFFLLVNGLVLIYVLTSPDEMFVIDLRSISTLLILPVVASSVIIGAVYCFIFAGVGIAGIFIVALLRVKPGLFLLEKPTDVFNNVSAPVALLIVMAGLSWFFDANSQNLISRLRERNFNLDTLNRELAQKRDAERQLSFQVNDFTEQVSSLFNEQARYIDNQLAAVLQVTITIEHFDQTNEAIARLARQVDLTAQESLKVAEDGTGNVLNALSSLLLISERTQEFANSMDDLYNQAHQIDQIIELITEVAEETNLLALNATIEAAGAREYGKRFASVANEVQRLANRSRDAADQVNRVMEDFRRAIQAISETAHQGVNETTPVISGSRQINSALDVVVVMAENTATLARQIALSSQQQREATVQLVATIRHISDISRAVSQEGKGVLSSLEVLYQAVLKLTGNEQAD